MRRGGERDSCTSTNDCRDGLACIAQVCTSDRGNGGIGGTGSDEEDAGPTASCGARRDCPTGMMCVSNVCRAQSMGTPPGTRYSGRGESCQAKNDCAGDLACEMNVCREVNLPLARTKKSCHRVECAKQEDCCTSFVPNANCAMYKMNCETDPIFCNTYRSLCECSLTCMDQMCVTGAPGCKADGECTSQQTPFCVDSRCAQCASDGDCPGMGAKCVAGTCMAACTIDENCPLLHSCKEGKCVDTGCKSDRECAFVTKNPRGACSSDGTCHVPCDADADCAMPTDPTSGFQVCDSGECVFVGCESDAECRALLGLENQTGTVHAECR
jgi:hypothetical protein